MFEFPFITTFACEATSYYISGESASVLQGLFKQTNRCVLYCLAALAGAAEINVAVILEFLDVCVGQKEIVFHAKNQDVDFFKSLVYLLYSFKNIKDDAFLQMLYKVIFSGNRAQRLTFLAVETCSCAEGRAAADDSAAQCALVAVESIGDKPRRFL